MPSADFGEKTNLDNRSLFIELKSKDESVRFRLAKGGHYDGKHFMAAEDGSWDISDCPRIMKAEECPICEKYFDLMREAKETEDKKIQKEIRKKARAFNAKITFYYPILDRESKKAKILKTTPFIRSEIEKDFKKGINVTQVDYILTRTEEEGSYYTLVKDEAFAQDLTDEEKTELQIAKGWNLEEKVSGKKSSQDFGTEENQEDSEVL